MPRRSSATSASDFSRMPRLSAPPSALPAKRDAVQVAPQVSPRTHFGTEDETKAEQDEVAEETKVVNRTRSRKSTAMQHRESWQGASAASLQARLPAEVLRWPHRRWCWGLSFIGAIAACSLTSYVLLRAAHTCGGPLALDEWVAALLKSVQRAELLVAMGLYAIYYFLYVSFWFGICICRCEWRSCSCNLFSVLDVLQTLVLWTYSCWTLWLHYARQEQESCELPPFQVGNFAVTDYDILAGLLAWNLFDVFVVMQLTYSSDEKELLWNAAEGVKPAGPKDAEHYEELPAGPCP